MPYGALKRLEIARALAAEPQLLLLDEPAAGLNQSEAREIDVLIKKLAADGTTVILVEHNMKLVMDVSDHVLVLDHGKKLAEGTPAQIASDPRVIEAYLGSNDDPKTPAASPEGSSALGAARRGRSWNWPCLTWSVSTAATAASRPCVASICAWPVASWWHWSAPTARARPRCCAQSRAYSLQRRQRALRRPRSGAAVGPSARAARHRPGARRSPGVRAPERRGQPAAGRVCPRLARWPARRVRDVPGPGQEAARVRRHLVGRPAADAGHRPRADGRSQAAAAR